MEHLKTEIAEYEAKIAKYKTEIDGCEEEIEAIKNGNGLYAEYSVDRKDNAIAQYKLAIHDLRNAIAQNDLAISEMRRLPQQQFQGI